MINLNIDKKKITRTLKNLLLVISGTVILAAGTAIFLFPFGINDNYVLIKLFVDDKKDLADPYTIEENGKKIIIETVGDKWSYLQRYKFQTSTQPYYVILDNDGNPLTTSRGYDPQESVDAFEKWLLEGVEKYKK